MPLTRQRVLDLAALGRRAGREALGLFLVEGVRSVEAALDAGAPLAEILVTDEAAQTPRVAALLARAAAPVTPAMPRELSRIGDAQTHQGVVALARRRAEPDAEALAGCRSVLVLDGVQDPGNVGTLVRTAAWFGADAVLADARTADFESPKVVRAAMGGLWDVRLARVPALGSALEVLRASGLALYGADLGGSDVAAWRPAGPAALVVGSEAHGLSPETLGLLDGRVGIGRGGGGPEGAALPGAESLNVAVAAGILLHRWLGEG